MSAVENRRAIVRRIVELELGWYPARPDGAEVTDETRLVEDMGADSLDLVELSMALEEEFDVLISDEAFEAALDIGTVAALYPLVGLGEPTPEAG